MSSFARRTYAAAWAALSHGTFLVAIACMAAGLYSGMQTGRGTLTGVPALLANGVLLLQFPLLHSFFLSQRGRRLMSRFVPFGEGKRLAPTTYATFASLQILAIFLLWSPSGEILWRAQGTALTAFHFAFPASWLLLMLALTQGGLGLQTGWIGWHALWKNERTRYPSFPSSGLFGLCRQPIYLGFGLLLWTGPVWTPDHVAVALTWSTYCLLGPLLKERRYLQLYGQPFESYRNQVPYFFPKIFS